MAPITLKLSSKLSFHYFSPVTTLLFQSVFYFSYKITIFCFCDVHIITSYPIPNSSGNRLKAPTFLKPGQLVLTFISFLSTLSNDYTNFGVQLGQVHYVKKTEKPNSIIWTYPT